MKYIVKGRSTGNKVWMGEADSPLEALSSALRFIGEPDDVARFFVVQPIVLATSVTNKAIEWVAEQDHKEVGIESLTDAIINYAEAQGLHLDWTGYHVWPE